MSDSDGVDDPFIPDSQEEDPDPVAYQQALFPSYTQIWQPRPGHNTSDEVSYELSQVGVRVAARTAGVSEDTIRGLPDVVDDAGSSDEDGCIYDEPLGGPFSGSDDQVSTSHGVRDKRVSNHEGGSSEPSATVLVRATPEPVSATEVNEELNNQSYSSDDSEPLAVRSKPHSAFAKTKSPDSHELSTPLPDPAPPTIQSSAYDQVKSQKLKVYKEGGLFELTLHSAKDEVTGQVAFQDVSLDDLEKISYLIAVNTHPRILETCLTGGWAQKVKHDKELAQVLHKLRTRSSMKHPFIYAQELADINGRSPTPNELLKAVTVAESYYLDSDRKMARRIDSVCTPRRDVERSKDPSYRKYVYPYRRDKNGKVTFPKSDSRIEIGLAFCKNLRKRIMGVDPSKMNEPLAAPLIEIGYSAQIATRFNQHKTHHNSNHIMNLFEAILSLMWPGRFSLHQFVIHCCLAGYETAMAEVFFTALCEGYIHNGGGFTHYSPGIGIGRKATISPSAEQWRETRVWSTQHMKVEETHAREVAFQNQLYKERLAANAQVETEIKDCEARIAAKKVEIEEHQRRFAADPNTADLLDMSADELEELQVDLEGQLHNKLAREVAELQALSEFMETLISQS